MGQAHGIGGLFSHGQGRKKKTIQERVLDGSATQAQRTQHEKEQARLKTVVDADGVPREDSGLYVQMPAGMTKAQQKVWQELAPHAMAAHTLTRATALAFRTLVEQKVECDAVLKRIKRDGWVVKGTAPKGIHGPAKRLVHRRPHPLSPVYFRLAHTVETNMIRFKLWAAGRPMEFVIPVGAGEEDPFAQFDNAPNLPPLQPEAAAPDAVDIPTDPNQSTH